MTRSTSDTELESYRYDNDSDSDDEADSTEVSVPGFNDKNSSEIATYLDSKLKKTKPMTKDMTMNTSTTNESNNKKNSQKFQSPTNGKPWVPLYQSTPVDIPSSSMQPRDILRAKSKLGHIVENATHKDSGKIEDLIEKSLKEDDRLDSLYLNSNSSTRGSAFQEDTPSKTTKKPNDKKSAESINSTLGNGQNPFTIELENLRKLKNYIRSLKNSEVLMENFDKNLNEDLIITTKEDVQQKANIEDENSCLKSKIAELNEQVSILKEINSSLKESCETKSKLLENHKEKVAQLEKELDKSKENINNSNQVITDLEVQMTTLKGHQEDAVTPEKYPIFNQKVDGERTIYEVLELSSVDHLTLVESQNIIKNILLKFSVPLSEIKTRIPQICMQLKHEKVLYDFANDIHKSLYMEEINRKHMQGKRSDSLLKDCTSEMLKKIETLQQRALSHRKQYELL